MATATATRKAPAKTAATPRARKTTTTTAPAPARLPKGVKPSSSLSKDLTRPSLTHAYIRKDRKRGWELLVTDTYMLARIPLKTDVKDAPPNVDEGFVPPEVLKMMERGESVTTADKDITVVESGVTAPRMAYFNGQQFPKFEQLIPEHETPLRIGINAELLQKLAKTLGSPLVELEIDLDKLQTAEKKRKTDRSHPRTYLKSIVVRPMLGSKTKTEKHDGDGLIMPVRVGD